MNKGYGGAVPKMRDTEIADKTYLGPHANGIHCQLKVGDTQSLVFKEGDIGPFWLTPQQREAAKGSMNSTNMD